MRISLRPLGCSEGTINTLLGQVFVRVHMTLRLLPLMEAYPTNHFRMVKYIRQFWA
jgi:hypothetical protein